MNFVPAYSKSKTSAKNKVKANPSAAAWKGLENNKRGDATLAYNAVRKDAERNNYSVSKKEAAMIAKKYVDPKTSVQRARAHHGVTVTKKSKKSKN